MYFTLIKCIFTPIKCIFTPIKCIFTPIKCIFTPIKCIFTPIKCILNEGLYPGAGGYSVLYTNVLNALLQRFFTSNRCIVPAWILGTLKRYKLQYVIFSATAKHKNIFE